MMPCANRDKTAPVSAYVSPRPNWLELESRHSECPPSSYIATSKETFVRVDGFSKIMARVLPLRVWGFFPALRALLRRAARFKIASISRADNSSNVRRSFFISSLEGVLQNLQSFPDFPFLDRQGRQHSERLILDGIDEQPLFQTFQDHRFRRPVQIDGDHQA